MNLSVRCSLHVFFVVFCVIYLDTPIDNICSLIFSLINISSVSSLSVSFSSIHILSSIYLLVVHRISRRLFSRIETRSISSLLFLEKTALATMAKELVVLIGVAGALIFITVASLIVASLGRLNTDQSLSSINMSSLLIRNSGVCFFCSVAIPYNTISKTLSREVQTSGLHVNAPGFKFIIFPSVFTSMEFDDISVECSRGFKP